MPRSDVAIRSAKPGPKPVKFSEEKSLFPLGAPSGGKLWRFKYRLAGKEKELALGRYPDLSLKDAREQCLEARKLITAGTPPLQSAPAEPYAAGDAMRSSPDPNNCSKPEITRSLARDSRYGDKQTGKDR